MKYTGNKSGLYVEEEKYKATQPILWPLIKILIVLLGAAAIFLISNRAFGDALPHVEKQNMERWLIPQACDEQCCEEESYAMIVIDRSKAYEMGGMDSMLPGIKLSDDMFLVVSGDPHWEFIVHIFQRENKEWKETFKVKMGVCHEGDCAK